MTRTLPLVVGTEDELDELMTRPAPELVRYIRTLTSPLVVLGAGGKMGPSLAVLAKRAAIEASHSLDVIAVSRFSDDNAKNWLKSRSVQTLTADLLDRSSLPRLPDARDVIYLVGMKFGTTLNPARTWAINALVPAAVCERYSKSRIVALSTGNVYPLAPVHAGGSRESDPLTPLGEYANAAVARERIFEYCSLQFGMPLAQMRLSYALDLRYGVVADIAQKVWREEPVELTTGHFNAIWQGDANDMILRALDLAVSPVAVFNLTSPAIYSVRETANRLGELLGRSPHFRGEESGTAFISETSKLTALLGVPPTPIDDVLRWVAHWTKNSGRSLNRPAHFDVRDGKF